MKFVKKLMGSLLILSLLLCNSIGVLAAGEGNMDGAGGGGMGQGTSSNKWSNGDEGIRVTIVKADSGAVVSQSIDLTDASPGNIVKHFSKTCKVAYRGGVSLTPNTGVYSYITPAQPLPQVINTSSGGANIALIKSYFTDEQVIRAIAGYCGMDFNNLISGKYKIFLEPLAYVTFQGTRTAMTATEAALYDKMLGGLMQSKMPSLAHKNLPLSIFLETADLGFPAWTGPRDSRVSDDQIISSLGLGIVRFNDLVTPPEAETADYEYRVNTDVITAVSITGGQSDPDHPVEVNFKIKGRTYPVGNVYYPEGASQLAWVKWRTPSTPQTVTITVHASGGGGVGKSTLKAKIVDLSRNDPPNPTANDLNKSYSASRAVIPKNAEKSSARWSVWKPWWRENWVWHSSGDEDDSGEYVDEGWWKFDLDNYNASLKSSMKLNTDGKSPTASSTSTKSGYGVNIIVNGTVSTNQTSAVTGPQNAVSYFPEFYYKTYWRLLDLTDSGLQAKFQFKVNRYSTYGRRTHFTPIWMPDGQYTVYTYLQDSWTPDGMLSSNLKDSIKVKGDLWKDWHIAPIK